MADPRIEKLAKLTVNYSVNVKKGDSVLIHAPILSEPLALEMYREVLLAGGHPIMTPIFERTSEIYFELAKDHHLDHCSPYKKFLYKNIDCLISIMADENTRSLANADTKKIARSQAANREIFDIYMERSAKGELKWCGLPYPTSALAQEGSMSLSEYEKFVYSACLVDRKDPIAEWKKVSKSQEAMVKYLNKVSKLEFYGEDTDLKMSVKGRKWINCDGKFNMPDGEVFSAPVENSVEGQIRFTFPGIYIGKEVEDITLNFKKGKIVKAGAEKGNDLLQSLIGIDDGAKRLGEVAIGTNYGIKKFTKNILFDEKLGGTIHMAIGSAYPECKAKNKSAIHWDMIKDMERGGEIIADGETVYKNGKWLK
ncbi:MAG: aminopeptidase [Euryarchaeota archaeon]|nr:aminopeptidase [Euryarchaeota archaeon]MBU4032999.1 aminopeptidase [Candidatus Thermoplasmatota archaeon]MBU4071837.1 aminopeptidase [Candidatus Thermoplasmatota archaeon]